jgi:CBS domain-containing protein
MRPAVTTVERGAHVAAAAYLMKQAGSNALVVTTDDAAHSPIAIVTDHDVALLVADGRDVNTTRINDLVPKNPLTATRETPVDAAAQQMLAAGIEHLPVVDGDRLVGMLSMNDACRGLLMSRGS